MAYNKNLEYISAANGSFASTNLSFSNTNGVSFSTSAGGAIYASHNGITSQTIQSQSIIQGVFDGVNSISSGTMRFSNSNGVSFGINGQTVTASHNGLTTARASNDGIGLNTAQSNVTWTVNSSGISFDGRGYAGTGTTFNGANISGSLTQNSNGINMSLSVAPGGGGADGYNILAAGTQTAATTGTVKFNDGNGITFGMANSSIITASHNGITSQSNQAVSGSNGSFTFQTATFGNLNGLSFYTSNGSLVGSHNGLTTARASNDAIGLNTAQSNATWTVNSSGLSFDGRGYAGTGTTFNGANVSGSMTMNSNGLQLSLSAGAGGGGVTPVASASNGSFSFTTLGFSNANNVTFGTSAGSIITASVAAPGAAAENNWFNLLGNNTAGNTTASGSTIGVSGINLTLSGTNDSVWNISAPATSSIVGGNGISISTDGSTITVGQSLKTMLFNHQMLSASSVIIAGQGVNGGSQRFFPIYVSEDIGFNAIRLQHSMSYISSSVSYRQSYTYQYGIFSINGSTLSMISSNSFSIGITNSSGSATVSFPSSTNSAGYTYTSTAYTATGPTQSEFGTANRAVVMDLAFTASMSLPAGLYQLGVLHNQSTSSANGGLQIGLLGVVNTLYASIGKMGVRSSGLTADFGLRGANAGYGAFTVTQTALQSTVALSAVNAAALTVLPSITFLSS